MDGYESILKFPNRFTDYERQPPNIFGYKGCKTDGPYPLITCPFFVQRLLEACINLKMLEGG